MYRAYKQVFFILVFAFFLFYPFAFVVHADFQASDVLGQFNSDGSANFTNQFTYGQGPNAIGFASPSDLVVDTTNHRLYVADATNCRVLVFNLSADNEPVDDTADYMLGGSSFTIAPCSEDVTAHSIGTGGGSEINMTLDVSGQKLFVSDPDAARVLVFDVATITNGEDAVKVLGALDFIGTSAVDSDAILGASGGMAYDEVNDRLFFADTSKSRVTVYDLSGGITNGMAAANIIGFPNFDMECSSGCGNPTASTTYQTKGIAYDPDTDYLYVANIGGDNESGRVSVFDVAPSTLQDNPDAIYILGQADFTATSTAVNSATLPSQPSSVTLDPVGNMLYVSTAYRILVFDVATISNGEAAVKVLGQSDFVSNVNKKNDVLSVDSYQTNANTFGSPTAHYGDDKLFVTDSSSHRVLIFDVAAITNGEDATDVMGQKDDGVDSFTKPIENNANTSLGFNSTSYTALDEVDHRLFVLNGQSMISVFNLDSNNRLVNKTADYMIGSDSLYREGVGSTTPDHFPYGLYIAYSAKQKLLFVAGGGNQYAIRVFDLSGGITTGMDASYIIGASSFSTNGGGQSSTRFYPYDIAVDDENDYLFVADNNQARGVLIFDISNGVSTNMAASYILGEESLSTVGGGGHPTDDTLNSSKGVVYDPNTQYLYVADTQRVLVLDVANGISTGMSASYVLGQSDFVSGASGTTQSRFEKVEGLAIDTENSLLYVSDGTSSNGNYRIMVFDVNSVSNGENAVAVIGKPNFTQTGQSALSASSFDGNTTIDFASTTRTLFVNDNAGRILLFNMIDFASGSLTSGTAGTAYSGGFTATSSQGTVTYELVSGVLPTGLSLNISTGALVGTPTVATTSIFQVKITDTISAAQTFYHTQRFTLEIEEAAAVASTPVATPVTGGGSGFVGAATRVSLPPTSTPVVPLSQPITGVTAFQIAQNLIHGDRGVGVRDLQQFLNAQGFLVSQQGPGSPGFETEYFGDATKNALIAFQRAKGISPATGFFGPLTRAAIGGEVGNATVAEPKNGATRFSLGARSPSVLSLQKFLNTHGFPVSVTGPGSSGNETSYFGHATRQAVMKFQAAYAQEILFPLGIKEPTGIVGEATAKYIEKIMNQE